MNVHGLLRVLSGPAAPAIPEPERATLTMART